MKKLLSIALLMLIVSSASAQFGSWFTKKQSDDRYYKKTDGVLTYNKVQVDSIKTFGRTWLNSLKDMGSTMKTVTIGTSPNFGGSCPLTDGQISFVRLEAVPYAQTLSSIKFMMQTAGNYTPDQENRVYLATFDGTTYTIVASSANDVADPNLFEATAHTVISKNFTTPYAAAANAILYAGFIYNSSAQTTAPGVYGVSTGNFGFMLPSFWGVTNLITGRVTAGTQNTLPASFLQSSCTQTAYFPLIMVY